MDRKWRKGVGRVVEAFIAVPVIGAEEPIFSLGEAVQVLKDEFLYGDEPRNRDAVEGCLAGVLLFEKLPPMVKCTALSALLKTERIKNRWVQDTVTDYVDNDKNREIVYEARRMIK